MKSVKTLLLFLLILALLPLSAFVRMDEAEAQFTEPGMGGPIQLVMGDHDRDRDRDRYYRDGYSREDDWRYGERREGRDRDGDRERERDGYRYDRDRDSDRDRR